MSQFNDVLNKKAVALSYDDSGAAAPIVVASGMGYLAERIIEVARKNDVPVYEDNSLATMLTQLELGSEIPEELYNAIVEIYVYFLKYKPKSEEEQKESDPSGMSVLGSKKEESTDSVEEKVDSSEI